MKINCNTVIDGVVVRLVPYRAEHVETYHRWMSDPFLQQTTESEPLSLEEEYAMQRSWSEDEDKCTFILLDKALPDSPGTGSHGGAMAGDVNIFLNDHEDRGVAEIEVMVAEERSRRKGMAREALQLFMAYAVGQLGITRFRAKILEFNAPSIALFSSLGFVETKRVAVFSEVHMELGVEGSVQEELSGRYQQLKLLSYDDA